MKSIAYLYYGLLALSLMLIYMAYTQYNYTTDFLNTGVKTKATVIKLIRINNDGGHTYKPVFEYFNKEGEQFIYKSNGSSYPAPYKIGEKIDIIYDQKTKKKRNMSYWGLYIGTVVSLAIAMPLLIIGGGYVLYSIEQNQMNIRNL